MTNPDENQLKNTRQRLTPIHRWTKIRACLSRTAWAAMFFETRVRAVLAACANNAKIAHRRRRINRPREVARSGRQTFGKQAAQPANLYPSPTTVRMNCGL